MQPGNWRYVNEFFFYPYLCVNYDFIGHIIDVVCIIKVSNLTAGALGNTSASNVTIDNNVAKFKYNLHKTDRKWLVTFLKAWNK